MGLLKNEWVVAILASLATMAVVNRVVAVRRIIEPNG